MDSQTYVIILTNWQSSINHKLVSSIANYSQNQTSLMTILRPILSIYFLCKTNTITILMHQMRISTTQVFSVMLRSKKLDIRKKCEKWKSHRMKTKKECHEILSQISQRIELCVREIILRFEMNLQNLLFSWQFNSYSYFIASTEVLSYWAVETVGD
jgi:hypothetical protein